jgi:hypothetical protein
MLTDVMKLKGLQQEQQLNQLKFQEYQRARADAATARAQAAVDLAEKNANKQALVNAMRAASVGDTGPQTPDMSAAANALIGQGRLPAALTALGASEAFTKDLKAKSDLGKVNAENVDKNLSTFRTFASGVNSPESAAIYAKAMYDHPVLGPLMQQTGYDKDSAAAKAAQDYASNPQQWMASHVGLTGEQVMKTLQQPQRSAAAVPAETPMANPVTSAAFNAGGASPVQLAMLGGVGTSPLLQMARPMPSDGGVTAPTRVAARTRRPPAEVEPEVLTTEDEGPPLPTLPPAQELKLRDQVAKDYEKAVAGIAGASGVLEAAGKVRTAKGLSGATGIVGLFPSAPDSAAAIAENRIQNLIGKVTLMGKSSAAATGAIGSIANQEWKILRDMVASLDKFKGEKALREQIEEIENQARGAEARIRDAYEKHHEQTVRRPAFKTYKDLPELKTFVEPEEQKKPPRRGTLSPAPQPAPANSDGWTLKGP